jgi:hypothetical protein
VKKKATNLLKKREKTDRDVLLLLKEKDVKGPKRLTAKHKEMNDKTFGKKIKQKALDN